MRSPGINGEGELRVQLANPGSPGKMAVKTEYVCVCVFLNLSFNADIAKPNDIVTFEMSTNEHSRFYIANQLWKMME